MRDMSTPLQSAREQIRQAKIAPLESDEAVEYYDVASKRAIFPEENDPSMFEKSFDYFIALSPGEDEEVALGRSKLGGQPHLPKAWKLPKKWSELQFHAQLNIADFKAHDLEDLFPEKGIFYIFLHPEVGEVGVHFEPNPEKLVLREDIETFEEDETPLEFEPHFMFHVVDVVAGEEKTAKHIPAALTAQLEKLLGGATMASTNPTQRIFGRPQFWQGEDEVHGDDTDDEDGDDGDDDEAPALPTASSVLVYHGELDDNTVHVWVDRAALKKGDFSKATMTFSGT